MKKIIISIILLICFLMTQACGPKYIKPDPLPELKFNKTPNYTTDLSMIITPDKPVHIWVDKDFNKVSPDKAKYLLLTNKEYAKYVAQLKIKKTYKEIITQQELLINQYIDIINGLKEYVELERLKAEEYRKLWVDSENAYRYERYMHSVDNAINKGAFGVISIGSLVMAILIAL